MIAITNTRRKQPLYRGFRDSVEGRGLTPTFARASLQEEIRNGLLVESASGVAAFTDEGFACHPSRQNILLQNRDFDTTWTVLSTPTKVQDEAGLGGVANTAWTLGDDNGAAFEAIIQGITVANDSNAHASHIFIKKDADTSRFPEIQLKLTGGTVQQINTQLNTSTGAKNDRVETGTVASSVESVTINGEVWWRLNQYVTNNTTGNVTLQMIIYPAATGVIGTTDATTTGEIIVDLPQIESNTTFTTSPIITTTAAVTRAATDLYYPNVLPVNDFVMVFDWTPYAVGQGTIGIFQCRQDASNLIKIDHNGTNIAMRIVIAGTTYTAFMALTIVAGTTYRIKVRVSSTQGKDIWTSSTKGTGDADTTDLVYGTNMYIGSFDGASHMSAAISQPFPKVYLGDYSDSWVASL